MSPDDVFIDFARANRLIAAQEEGTWAPLTGGVSSDIWHLRSTAGESCIKRALPELKVTATWRVPVDRNAFEWAYMQVVDGIAPGSVPKLFAHDPKRGLFAMAWLSAERHRLWKSELLNGCVDIAFAAQVGDLLGRIHSATARDPSIPAAFATDANFHALRIEPYLSATAEKHVDLAPTIRRVAATIASTKLALVHGDVSPKNILAGPEGPVLLDAECAWFGDPAFDLAFCLNHLAIKTRFVPRCRDGLIQSFDEFVSAYLRRVDWESSDRLETRAAHLLPILSLARVDGKSPAEYLTAGDRDTLRVAARKAIFAASDNLQDAREILIG